MTCCLLSETFSPRDLSSSAPYFLLFLFRLMDSVGPLLKLHLPRFFVFIFLISAPQSLRYFVSVHWWLVLGFHPEGSSLFSESLFALPSQGSLDVLIPVTSAGFGPSTSRLARFCVGTYSCASIFSCPFLSLG
jgi:hypothetical protein